METLFTTAEETINHLKSVTAGFKERCGEITATEPTETATAIEILRDGVISAANPEVPISTIRPLLLVLNEFMFLMKDLTAALNL